MPKLDTLAGHRRRWVVLLAATAVAAAGFWTAGRGDGAIGILSLPLFWTAAYLTRWWSLPAPAIALAAGLALGNATDTNDEEYAWMTYFAGLLLCQTAVIWGTLQRRQTIRTRSVGPFPERPRRD
jgi:hypothetical protein